MKVLVTGSSGLVGSETVSRFDAAGHDVVGADNNQRREFFGPAGDTAWNLERLRSTTRKFVHHPLDIRDRDGVMRLFREGRFDLVVHCAGQPSHDRAREIPLTDFEVNAGGTMNLLEATRLHAPEAVFVMMSTNKVYGDAPNRLPLEERETRWEYAREEDRHGVSEECPVDQSLHSLFGASKLAADVMTQEYARTFGLRTGVFRGGCLTGPRHSGVELHGFLSYLVHAAVTGRPYTVYGHGGKQVRDQLHAGDVAAAVDAFAADPKPGGVYNLGGGRANSASILECIRMIGEEGGGRVARTEDGPPRLGDHVCYITDLRKFRRDYPGWNVSRPLREIVREMIAAERERKGEAR